MVKDVNITLGKVTVAIAEAASTSGTGYNPGEFNLPKDDPELLELQALTRLRAISKDPLERQTLSLSIFSIRRKVRTKRSNLQYWNAIKTGRAPFSQKKVERVFALKDYKNLDIVLDDPEEILENVEKLR